jgi:anhydro-N-acetylmuramic acid kinase
LTRGLFIGLISGTSMDAVNAVLAEASAEGFRVLAGHGTPMPVPLATRLRRLAVPAPRVHADPDVIDELGDLDALLGELFAAAALSLLAACGLEPPAIRAIGSHGQTLRHRPRAPRPFTLQIGDPNIIAARTGIPVVADFRRRDMALGGQGAPLVPGFHAAVFADPGERRAVLNLGGIANVTLLEPDQAVTGFDTGPANGLMDAWARRHLGRPFDDGGAWAAAGTVSGRLLEALLAHPFLALPAPKSTGPEDFTPAWLDEAITGTGPMAPDAVQATLCEFTAVTVAGALRASSPQRLIVCGGGAHNRHLLTRLAAHLPQTTVETSEMHDVDPDQVEGAAFAWLAARTLSGLPGNVPTVTGARRATVLGALWPADPDIVPGVRP